MAGDEGWSLQLEELEREAQAIELLELEAKVLHLTAELDNSIKGAPPNLGDLLAAPLSTLQENCDAAARTAASSPDPYEQAAAAAAARARRRRRQGRAA